MYRNESRFFQLHGKAGHMKSIIGAILMEARIR